MKGKELLSKTAKIAELKQQEKPTLANLRESGACEQDSDMVLILNRPPNGIWEWEETESTDSRGKRKTVRQRVQRPWDAELELAKDRNGETTTLSSKQP